MKDALTYTAMILGLVIGSLASTAFAQTTANGPYYANPSWDQQLPASTRFIVLSNWSSAAVLDRETGLVWERSPDATQQLWANALSFCLNRNVGGRNGWRLPSIVELASLMDPSVVFPGPVLPPGHPFANVQQSSYWSATSSAAFSGFAWSVDLSSGSAFPAGTPTVKFLAWCVRGGMNTDQY